MCSLVLLVGLPPAGVLLCGSEVLKYLQFPPATRYVRHAPFSWPVFIVLALSIACAVAPFDFRVFATRSRTAPGRPPGRRFPWWGSVGVLFGLAAWVVAWTRFRALAPIQPHTFTPLWLAFVVVVNALTWRRSGSCMLLDRPRYLGKLFLLSAGFWWFFEYLNRFVQNWYYVGAHGMSPLEYFLYATLPFSTVLPAVLGTYELLRTYPRAGAGLDGFLRVRVPDRRLVAWPALILAGAGLAGIGLAPDLLFPLLWISPLAVIISLRAIAGRPTLLAPLAEGRWRRIYLLAAAALVCGFFWELWNYASYAKWVYSIPFVNRFKLFEMPVLGYAGYIPFGPICAAVAGLLGDGEGTARDAGRRVAVKSLA